MIVVRDIFQLHFGRAREALELVKQGLELEHRHAVQTARVLTDLTGEYYTLVIESEFQGLGEMETALAASFQDPAWREWYTRFVPLVQSGRREIFRVAYAAPQARRAEPVVTPAPA